MLFWVYLLRGLLVSASDSWIYEPPLRSLTVQLQTMSRGPEMTQRGGGTQLYPDFHCPPGYQIHEQRSHLERVSSRSSHPSWHHTIRIEQTHLSSFQIPLAHQAQNIMFQNTKFQATKFKPLRENSVLSSIALKSSITVQKIIGLYFLSLSFLKMQLCCSLFYVMFLRSLMAA